MFDFFKCTGFFHSIETKISSFRRTYPSVTYSLHSQVSAHSEKTPFFKLNIFKSIHKPFYLRNYRTCSHSNDKSNLVSSSGDEFDKPQDDFTSVKRSSIARSIISRCSYLWEKKSDPIEQLSLKDTFLKLSDISPKTIRPFWRFSTLEPHDVLNILGGFEFDCGNPAIEARKVGILWKLFNWASEQRKDFEHSPQSYEIMATLLTRVGLLKEAESLLRIMGARGILSGCHDIFNNLIEEYASGRELESSISMYNFTRGRGFVPSESCFIVLLKLLIEKRKAKSTYRVYTDMVEMRLGLSSDNMSIFESVVKLLCKKRMVKEARNVFRKIIASGLEPNRVLLNLIADGYSEKKDFVDLLNFLKERKCVPDVAICNKILSVQCRNFGSEQAYMFMMELENLGFNPDAVTFSIFISCSCREGKLKDSFIYLSELLSRCLKPDVHTYNALISGVFMKGMWKHAGEIFHEMLEGGITPDLSTFKVLLAGYCKFRQFDEAKTVILEMVNRDLIQLSPLEDPLSRAFLILGFKPLAVKLKRDNDSKLCKAEFFDTLGNGLYVETDMEKYENILLGVLEDAMISDCNSLIVKECEHGNIRTALMLKDTMTCRGQKLSSSAYSGLLKRLCGARSSFSKAICLYEEMPELVYHIDQETLNLFIQVVCKKGVPQKASVLLEGMLLRKLTIQNETYTALIMGLCKKGYQKELHNWWQLARNHEWLPSLNDCKVILGCLCRYGMIKEVLELLENILASSTQSFFNIGNVFLEVLCGEGHVRIGQIFLHEVLRQDKVFNYTAYSHLLSGFCKDTNYKEAFRILDTMLENDSTPSLDVSDHLIFHLCRFHRLEKAMILKDIMLQEKSVSFLSVYHVLVHGLCKGGKIGLAATQLQEMVAKGIFPDADICNVMIQGYCKDNSSRRVGELLGVMMRNNFSLSISSYHDLVKMLCMHCRMSHAMNLKEILLKESKSPLVAIYNILIFRFSQTGESSLITVLLDEMRSKGLVLDEASYNFLICGSVKSQDVSRAVEVMNTMIDKDLRPSKRSFRTVIRHLCNHGNLNKALDLSRAIESRAMVHCSVVQHAIVEGLLSHGRLQEAENYLKRIEVRGLIPNIICYDGLIKRFCQCGRLNMAVDLLDIMLKKGNLPSGSCYDSLLQGFCVGKSVDDALNFLSEMLARDLEPCSRSWNVLIHELCRNGHTVESEKLLDSIIRYGQIPTPSMYQAVIDRYCSENNHNKASELLHKMQQHGYVPDFKTHWSLVSNLSNSNKDNTKSGGFLSKLLSLSGFTKKK